MKKWFLNMLVVGVLGALAVSCSDEYDELGLDSRKAQVMFSVAMDTPSARSRATWEDNQNSTSALIGDDFDNKIDLNQLTVKIEAGGKTYNVVNPIKWKVEGTKNEYKIVGIVDGIDQNTRLTDPKFTVYANMDEEQETFDATYSAETPNGVQSIPMWGVMTYGGTLNFDLGKRVDIGNIYLLRAMAKIEVALNEEMNGEYDLVGATLNKYNGTGNCLPNDDALQAAHTTSLELEEVFNPNASSKQDLIFNKVGNSYVVYLPEVAKGTSEAESLNIEVALRAKGASEESEPETGNFKIMDYATNPEAPTAIDIVRNHWYKYTISGFSASEVQVNYQTVDWQPINIEVGGEGFLFLNKDVIEIYNSNIDADQLKFSSSSPIKSIELKDLYKHDDNGEITEGTEDTFSAYYISKFGQKVQLGTDPGFDFENKAQILENEKNVLNSVRATFPEGAKDGCITINSPFINCEGFEDSHNDTPRYLEFKVTNNDGLTATFRVVQYPPVNITNVEGYYSYREDHLMTDDPTEKPISLHNYNLDNVFITAFHLVHCHDFTNEPTTEEWLNTPQVNRNYSFATRIGNSQESDDENWEDFRYGMAGQYVTVSGKEYYYSGLYRSNDKGAKPFLRHYYKNFPSCASNILKQGAPIGDPFIVDVNGETKIYRKHYTWQALPFFWPKFAGHYYENDGTSVYFSNSPRLKGQVDMHEYGPSTDGGKTWGPYGYHPKRSRFVNHRMYNIRFNNSSSDYVIGYPELTDDGLTVNTVSNSNRISPNIAIASQLGETYYDNIYNYVKNNSSYKLPSLEFYFEAAERHCKNYVETSYVDSNGNHEWDEGEIVTHYNDWRLPTKKEIDMIIDYQTNSRAMDKLLTGQYYLCTTGKTGDSNSLNNGFTSAEVPGYTESGFYVRCVRDIKSDEQNGIKLDK